MNPITQFIEILSTVQSEIKDYVNRILFSYLFEAGCYYVLLSIELEQEDPYFLRNL